MLVCPKCKSEYQEGYKICSDCKCELIEIAEVVKKDTKVKIKAKLIQFVLGVLFILCSPILSYKFTSMYFIPNGDGEYINEQFLWMLKAYHYSFLFVGGIICLSSILYWYKNYEKK
jgi:hypothetical protein